MSCIASVQPLITWFGAKEVVPESNGVPSLSLPLYVTCAASSAITSQPVLQRRIKARRWCVRNAARVVAQGLIY